MKTVVVEPVYRPCWPYLRFFPLKSFSDREVSFGSEGIVKFEFEQRRMVFMPAETQEAIEMARLEPQERRGPSWPTSMAAFQGRVVGAGFEIVIRKNWLSAAKMELSWVDAWEQPQQAALDWVHLSLDVHIPASLRCRRIGSERLEVTYAPEVENMARVTSAFLLSHAIAASAGPG